MRVNRPLALLALLGSMAFAFAGCKTTSSTSGGSAGSPAPTVGGAGGSPMPGSSGGDGGAGSQSKGSTTGGAGPVSGDATGGAAGGPAGDSNGGEGMPAGSGGDGKSIEDLDGELDDSLGEFDDRVAGAGTASGEIDILDPSGRNTGGLGSGVPVFEEAEIGSGDVENPDIEERAEEGYEGAGEAGTVAGGAGGAGTGETYPVPDDIGDGQGDDIVLRQIREAAMNESDPELRKKLWDEYRRIKGQ